MDMDKPPIRWAQRHLWLAVLLTVSLTGLSLLLVIPSYRSGIYLYDGHFGDMDIPIWMHNYWVLGIWSIVLEIFVPFIILPLVLGSVLVHWFSLTRVERVIWVVLSVTTFVIFRETLDIADVMVTYIFD